MSTALAPIQPIGNIAPAVEQTREDAREYARRARAASTLRAYKLDWESFTDWCSGNGLCALPATPETVASYLAAPSRGT